MGAPLYRLLAWLSPAYPIGAFSYSHGVETAVEEGFVRDRATLVAWLDSVLRQGTGAVDGALFAAGWRAAVHGAANGDWAAFDAASLALAAVAVWPLVLLGRPEESWAQSVTYAIAGVFVARGVAGFTPTWKAHFRDEPFATRNRRYYSKYCLLMGIAYVALLAGELERP